MTKKSSGSVSCPYWTWGRIMDPDPFDTDPDPAFHFDTDPDPAFQFDTDLDPTI
jgi:hypothetical protein